MEKGTGTQTPELFQVWFAWFAAQSRQSRRVGPEQAAQFEEQRVAWPVGTAKKLGEKATGLPKNRDAKASAGRPCGSQMPEKCLNCQAGQAACWLQFPMRAERSLK